MGPCDPVTWPPAGRLMAGKFAAEVMSWVAPAGSVRFEATSAPRTMVEAAAGDDD